MDFMPALLLTYAFFNICIFLNIATDVVCVALENKSCEYQLLNHASKPNKNLIKKVQ